MRIIQATRHAAVQLHSCGIVRTGKSKPPFTRLLSLASCTAGYAQGKTSEMDRPYSSKWRNKP